MITATDEIQQITELLGGVYRGLTELQRDVLPVNPGLYAVMAEGNIAQIRQFYKQLDELTGFSTALERQSDLWLRLEGPQITGSYAPVGVLITVLTALEKGVLNIARSISSDLPERRLSRSPMLQDLRRACGFQVVALEAGRLQIGLCLSSIEDLSQQDDDPTWQSLVTCAREALSQFLDVMDWLASDADVEELVARFRNRRQCKVAMASVRSLLPCHGGAIESMEIAGHMRPFGQPIRLLAQSKDRLRLALKALSEPRMSRSLRA